MWRRLGLRWRQQRREPGLLGPSPAPPLCARSLGRPVPGLWAAASPSARCLQNSCHQLPLVSPLTKTVSALFRNKGTLKNKARMGRKSETFNGVVRVTLPGHVTCEERPARSEGQIHADVPGWALRAVGTVSAKAPRQEHVAPVP